MTWLSIAGLMFVSAEVGWLAAWFVFDKKFHEPLRKSHKEALEGWSNSIEMLEKIAKRMGWIKNEDGSMVSPIQVNNQQQ